MAKYNISVGTKAWADRINAEWRKSAESIIAAGRLLIECKEKVEHGAFGKMLTNELDFDERTAQRLMEIGADERLANPSILPLLPKAWTRLHKLTKLSDEALMAELTDEKPQRESAPRSRAPRAIEPPTITDAKYHAVTNSGDSSGPGSSSEQVPPIAEGGEPIGLSEAATPAAPTEPDDGLQPLRPPLLESGSDFDFVPVKIRVGDPASVFAGGLELAMKAAMRLPADQAVLSYPDDTPLLSDDLSMFIEWLMSFEAHWRATHGAGNPIALAAE